MATISTLTVNLIARTSAFTRGIKRSKKSLRGLTASIGKFQRRMVMFTAGVVSIGAMTMALKKSIMAASEAEETFAKFSTVFGKFSKDAEDWAKTFGRSVGRANRDVQKWMATLQDTFVPMGMSREEALEMTKSLTKLAVDVASFNNQLDEDVLNNFTSALVGNHRAVMRYGIVITEARLQQEAFSKGIYKTFKNLSAAEKAQLRYSIILKSTEDAQGDALRTADSFANQLKRAEANAKNLNEMFGKTMLPIATAGLMELNKHLTKSQENFEDIEGSTGAISKKVTDVISGLAKGVAFVVDVFNAVRGVVNGVIAVIQKLLQILLKVQGTVLKALLPEKLEFPSEVMLEISDAFGEGAKINWDQAKEQIMSVGDATRKTGDFMENLGKTTKAVIEELEKRPPAPIMDSEAMNRQMELMQKAKRVFEQTRTPLEKYEMTLSDLNEMLEKNLITWDTYGRAVRAAQAELRETDPVGAFNSAEAREIRTRFVSVSGLSQGTRDPAITRMDEQIDIGKQQLAVLRQIETKEALG